MTDVDDGVNGVVDFSVDPAVRSLFGVRPISNLSGDLLITHSLDRETRDSYSFTLLAIDRGSPPLTGQTAINITIVVSLPSLVFTGETTSAVCMCSFSAI